MVCLFTGQDQVNVTLKMREMQLDTFFRDSTQEVQVRRRPGSVHMAAAPVEFAVLGLCLLDSPR